MLMQRDFVFYSVIYVHSIALPIQISSENIKMEKQSTLNQFSYRSTIDDYERIEAIAKQMMRDFDELKSK